jgi:hypothetical protein
MATIYEKMTAIGNAIREKTGGTELLSLDDMATEIAGISAGAELNFEVVGGTTQPVSGVENTIWINTNTEITSWAFSYAEPENPAEGMVWICTGSGCSVDFNALKNNTLEVYPMSAKQYINGSWVNMDAHIYQNGGWLQFRLYLYKEGDECTAITGGWSGTKSSNYMSFGGADNNGPQAYTNNKISFEGYTKLVFEYEFISGHGSGLGNIQLAASDRTEIAYRTDYATTSIQTSTLETGKIYTVEIDVSSVTLAAYVRCGGWYGSGKLYNAWLER